MKKALLLFICIYFIAAGCKNKDNHLPSAVMQKVLTDITLAEGYAIFVRDTLHPAGSKNYDSLGSYYKDILAHYKVTKEQFNESMDWYKKHPEELDSIYARMQSVITAKSPNTKQTAPQIPPPAPPLPGSAAPAN